MEANKIIKHLETRISDLKTELKHTDDEITAFDLELAIVIIQGLLDEIEEL
jgi:septation ring formation regulator EzrA